MDYNYEEGKIIFTEEVSNKTLLVRIKHKHILPPGKFIIFWLSGFGEFAVPIFSSSKDFFEIIINKNSGISNFMIDKKKKVNLLFRGPYGHGFPMNNLQGSEFAMICEEEFISPLISAAAYIKNEGIESKLNYILVNSSKTKLMERIEKMINPNHQKLIFNNDLEKLKEHIEKLEFGPDTVFLLSFNEKNLMDIISFLKTRQVSQKRIYIYINKKIYCGLGKCGRCMEFGKHICADGPVFRLDDAQRLLS